MKSSLSNYLQPIATQEKTTKTGTARVLTSAECMEILDEKQRKKEQEAKEKEERKRERERKKIEREELAKKKNEERLEKLKKRQEEVAKKQMEVAARKAARAAKVTKGQRSTRGRDGTSTGFTAHSVSTTSVDPVPTSVALSSVSAQAIDPPSSLPGPSEVHDLASPVQQGSSTEEECECSFCYGSYCQDGREWVKCACGRWVHEQCMEDVYLDDDGQERFCPFCLN